MLGCNKDRLVGCLAQSQVMLLLLRKIEGMKVCQKLNIRHHINLVFI